MAIEFLPAPGSAPEDYERELTPEEIESYVKPKYEAAGSPLPNSGESIFIGLIRGGKIVGALGVQVKIHAEPLMLDPGYAAALPALVKAAESHILSKCGPQYVYLFTPAGRIAQLAVSMGMQLEPWVVMSKLVMPEVPTKTPVELPAVVGGGSGESHQEQRSLETMPTEGGTQ